jgi:hypothetical protein
MVKFFSLLKDINLLNIYNIIYLNLIYININIIKEKLIKIFKKITLNKALGLNTIILKNT